MSNSLDEDFVVATVETSWRDANLAEIEESGDCSVLADALRTASVDNYQGLQLLYVGDVDMFWMCGSERPEFEHRNEDWKPAFLILFSPHGVRFAGVWVSGAVQSHRHTPTVMALCAITSEGDCGTEIGSRDFFAIAEAIDRNRSEGRHD